MWAGGRGGWRGNVARSALNAKNRRRATAAVHAFDEPPLHCPRAPPAGNKSSLELRGPVDAPPPRPLRPVDVPGAVAKGLHMGVRAAAAGAIAGGKMGAEILMPSSGPDSPTTEEEEAVPPQVPFHSPPSEHALSAEASTGDSASAAEPQPGGGAASRSPAVPHSPFDAPAAPGGAAPSPRDLRHTLSAPASAQDARLSQLHGPSPLGSGHATPTAAASFAAATRAKHLRRASMQENALVETLSTEPGTMLVRVTSTGRGATLEQHTPTGRQLRRL